MSEILKCLSKYTAKPKKGKEGSAGFDLYLPLSEGPLFMPYGTRRRIDTGVVLNLDAKSWVLLAPRSSANSRGVRISNTIGIVDPTYSGPNDHLKIDLTRDPKADHFIGKLTDDEFNEVDLPHWLATRPHMDKKGTFYDSSSYTKYQDSLGNHHFFVEVPDHFEIYGQGERFAQMVIIPFHDVTLLQQTLEEWSGEDRGGYGSSGQK
jgi:dUTPase